MVQPCSTPISEFCVCVIYSLCFSYVLPGPYFGFANTKAGKLVIFQKSRARFQLFQHISAGVSFSLGCPQGVVYTPTSPPILVHASLLHFYTRGCVDGAKKMILRDSPTYHHRKERCYHQNTAETDGTSGPQTAKKLEHE